MAHTDTQLDLRGLRDKPLGVQERITARLLVTQFALRSPEYTDWLIDDLTCQQVEWLHIDELGPDDMREWASTLRHLWPDAAAHLNGLASRVVTA